MLSQRTRCVRESTKEHNACVNQRDQPTLLHTLQPDGVPAVPDHGLDVPGGEPGHRGVVDLQEELTPGPAGPASPLSSQDGELAELRAPPQLEPQLPLRGPAQDTLMDFVGPVALLLQAFGHG